MVTIPCVVVRDAMLPPGGVGTVRIAVYHLPELQSIQVGPTGAVIFDPEVIWVRDVRGINGFQVLASHIDNQAGKVIFAAGYPGGGIGSDGIVELEVEAVGRMGSETSITITQIDVLADMEGNDIIDYEIINGEVSIFEPLF
jgi:hypothetical protein